MNSRRPKTARPKHRVKADVAEAADAARATRREAAGAAADLASLRAHPAFRAGVEAARASFARGEDFSGDELDERLGITDEDKAAGDAWLDEYERRLEQLAREAHERRESAVAG